MKVIVAGGAGFIGSHIVDALLTSGHQPFVVDNFTSGSRNNLPPSVPVFDVDIRDGKKLGTIFDEVQPGWVCHQAAQLSVSRSMRDPVFDAENNVMGLLNVFDHAARIGVLRIVFASSGGVLYGDVSTPVSEDQPQRPISPYGISKSVGERYLEFYARERGLCGVALRYSNVYGPRQNPAGEAGVVAIFCTAMLSGNSATINGDGRYVRDYVFGPDVAQANVAALTTTFDSHFIALNIGTGLGTDVNQLAEKLRSATVEHFAATGKNTAVADCRYGAARLGDLRSNLISPLRAKSLMGWTPATSLEDGLRQTVGFFAKSLNR